MFLSHVYLLADRGVAPKPKKDGTSEPFRLPGRAIMAATGLSKETVIRAKKAFIDSGWLVPVADSKPRKYCLNYGLSGSRGGSFLQVWKDHLTLTGRWGVGLVLACFESAERFPLPATPPTIAQVCKMTGLSQPTVRAHCEALRDRRFLVPTKTGLVFNPDEYQKAVNASYAVPWSKTETPRSWIEAATVHMGRMQDSVMQPLEEHADTAAAVADLCYSRGLPAAAMVSELKALHESLRKAGRQVATWAYVRKSIENAFS
jgi:hypothetical protein